MIRISGGGKFINIPMLDGNIHNYNLKDIYVVESFYVINPNSKLHIRSIIIKMDEKPDDKVMALLCEEEVSDGNIDYQYEFTYTYGGEEQFISGNIITGEDFKDLYHMFFSDNKEPGFIDIGNERFLRVKTTSEGDRYNAFNLSHIKSFKLSNDHVEIGLLGGIYEVFMERSVDPSDNILTHEEMDVLRGILD